MSISNPNYITLEGNELWLGWCWAAAADRGDVRQTNPSEKADEQEWMGAGRLSKRVESGLSECTPSGRGVSGRATGWLRECKSRPTPGMGGTDTTLAELMRFRAWTRRRPSSSANAGLDDTIPLGLGGIRSRESSERHRGLISDLRFGISDGPVLAIQAIRCVDGLHV